MSLVAYDSSGESEEETIPKSVVSAAKRQRDCIKITIPSLKEFEDEESPVVPKKPKLQSGSGLFSLLPPPKNTSTLSKPGFVPYILSSKKESLTSQKCETKFTKTELSQTLTSDVIKEQNDKESNEKSSKDSPTITNKDFFSLEFSSNNKLDDKRCSSPDYIKTGNITEDKSSVIQSPPSTLQLSATANSDMQLSFMGESTENSCFQQYHLLQPSATNYSQEHLVGEQSDTHVNYSAEPVTEFNSRESLLKDKEFLKLQGRRNEFEAVDIIDVNADDQLMDRNEWLMKSLTEESTHRPSRKKHNMPTQQQKRKHQITYLAFQAKEREMDLKNQWAMNSRTRRETQAKYGF